MAERLPKPARGQFMAQGQTSNTYGNDPSLAPKGDAGKEPKELRP